MRVSLLGLFGLFGIGAAAGAWAAEDAGPADASQRLAPDVASVVSCADPDGVAGYRTVVLSQGFEHVYSEVYLQWLEWDQDGAHVVASVRVAELGSGLWSVGTPMRDSRKNCAMRRGATHTYSARTASFLLQPVSRGKYAIRNLGGAGGK